MDRTAHLDDLALVDEQVDVLVDCSLLFDHGVGITSELLLLVFELLELIHQFASLHVQLLLVVNVPHTGINGVKILILGSPVDVVSSSLGMTPHLVEHLLLLCLVSIVHLLASVLLCNSTFNLFACHIISFDSSDHLSTLSELGLVLVPFFLMLGLHFLLLFFDFGFVSHSEPDLLLDD